MHNAESQLPLRIGVSQCLVGERVRYDGGHKRDDYLVDQLLPHLELIPICPEVAIGLGIPRPPVQLQEIAGEIRALGVDDPRLEVTRALQEYGSHCAQQLTHISGYLFKARSPSCGLYSTPLHRKGKKSIKSSGIFAASLQERLPLVPMEEEQCLHDLQARDHFLERVFCYHRWQQLRNLDHHFQKLEWFHYRHRLALLSHHWTGTKELDKLIAGLTSVNSRSLADRYITIFMEIMKSLATPRKHARVLHSLAATLKQQCSADEHRALLQGIEDYGNGKLPRITPIRLIRDYALRDPHIGTTMQYYLFPPPLEARLRDLQEDVNGPPPGFHSPVADSRSP